ncbi:MAG: hypothetical protein ACYDAO_04205 [Thermoplasmataceae archaeon]
MISKKILGASTAGIVIGVSQTALLREFVDKPMAKKFLATNPTAGTPGPFLMKTLGNFGSPSAVFGIAGGVTGIGVGLYGAMKDKPIANNAANLAITNYGASALATGIYSGVFPTIEWSAGVKTDPANPITSGFGRKRFSSDNNSALQGKAIDVVGF